MEWDVAMGRVEIQSFIMFCEFILFSFIISYHLLYIINVTSVSDTIIIIITVISLSLYSYHHFVLVCHLASPIIVYHHLSSSTIVYHHISSSFIVYHRLSSPIITYHQHRTNMLWGAGLSFSKCHAERKAPYDPHTPFIFDGEHE